MKTAMIMVLFVLSVGCMTGYRGYVPTPTAVPTTPSASAFPAAPVLPTAGSYGTPTGVGYYVEPPPLEGIGFIDGHGYPGNWRGSNLVKVKNPTDYFVAVRMDGFEVVLLDGDVALPYLPPGQEAWFFIPFSEMGVRDSCESHDFEFRGVLESDVALGVSRAVAEYRRESCFSPSRDRSQTVEISRLCFAGRC